MGAKLGKFTKALENAQTRGASRIEFPIALNYTFNAYRRMKEQEAPRISRNAWS